MRNQIGNFQIETWDADGQHEVTYCPDMEYGKVFDWAEIRGCELFDANPTGIVRIHVVRMETNQILDMMEIGC